MIASTIDRRRLGIRIPALCRRPLRPLPPCAMPCDIRRQACRDDAIEVL